jgi:hypothetical protein
MVHCSDIPLKFFLSFTKTGHRQLYYRIGFEVVIGLVNPKTFKKFALTLQEGFKGTKEQRFSEPAGSREEIAAWIFYDLIKELRFIYIKKVSLSNLGKRLSFAR